MNRLVLILLLFTSQARAGCEKVIYSQNVGEWKGYDQLAEVICSDNKGNGKLDLGRVRDGWARVLVDRKIIYYLKLTEKNWTIVAKGPRFDVEMWERLGIPSWIR